jgi:hypothetical protein
MSVFDTTSAVVKAWATLQVSPSPTDQLQVLWAPTQAPFFPDACRDLIKRIYAAFPGATNLKSDLSYKQIKDSTANTGGDIATVDDLSDAIAESLTAHEVVYLPPMALAMAASAASGKKPAPKKATARKAARKKAS